MLGSLRCWASPSTSDLSQAGTPVNTDEAFKLHHYLKFANGTRRLSAERRQQKTYGEGIFELYLEKQHVLFEHEPSLGDRTAKLIDYVIRHEDRPVYLEVKDIEKELPDSGAAFDPYGPIRSEITAGMKKFRKLRVSAAFWF